eukprot:GAHX01004029.1.p2 GENE.GAHX01004029.1~~GAHX01004029.1.p2  ORF type:complete len:61 (-),score=8.22 GAHX01004029.1:335-517(-)
MVNNIEFLVLPHQHHWFLLHIFNFSEVEKKGRTSKSKKGLTENIYHLRKDERLQGDLQNI